MKIIQYILKFIYTTISQKLLRNIDPCLNSKPFGLVLPKTGRVCRICSLREGTEKASMNWKKAAMVTALDVCGILRNKQRTSLNTSACKQS